MPIDPKVLELQTAEKILAEIFEIDIHEVEETIRQRCEDGVQCEDRSQWPERLWAEDSSADAEPLF